MDTRRPFRHSDLVDSGTLTRHHLIDGRFTPLFRGVSVDRDVVVTAAVRASGAALLHPGAVVVGVTAAAIWGAAYEPLDVAVDLAIGTAGRRSTPGVRLHRIELADDEVVRHGAGVQCSTPARTAYDIARWLPRGEAVVVLDALARRTGVDVDEIRAVAAAHPGDRDVRAVDPVLAWVDARSPDEERSRERVRLLARGIPVPVVEQHLLDARGDLVAPLALAWPEARTGLAATAGTRERAWDIGWDVVVSVVDVPVDEIARWVRRSRERWDLVPRVGMPRPLRLPPPPEPDGRCDGGLSRLVPN